MQSLVVELDAFARADGERLHSVQGEKALTYSEFVAATHKVAHGLRREGVQPGEAIAVWSRNDLRMLQAIYGALRCKALFVPLNARNSVAENLVLLRRFNCKALFVQTGLIERDLLAREVPGLRCVVPLDSQPDCGPAFDAWRDLATEERFPEQFTNGSDAAAIFPTSGTTGEPKGVVHSHLGMSTMARGYRELLKITSGGKQLVVGPITHVAGGVVYATTGMGCTQVLLDSTHPSDILDAIERESATLLFAPPTLVYGMLDEQLRKPRKLSSLQVLIYAGSAISPVRLQQAMRVFGPILMNVYSQSELIYPVTSLTREDHERIAGGDEHLLASAGRATAQGEVSIMDEEGRQLSSGEVGEIVTRSLGGMQCFIGDPAATEAMRTHGWHHTGDIGRLDEEGFLFIVDRKKDMIISGGFNVYSAEVEAVLFEHPAVLEAAVVGVPDPKWGEAVCAVVVVRPGQSLEPEVLRSFCRDKLGGVKTPKQIILRDVLPRNSAGKILKRKLRDSLAEPLV
ncbi:acyl-CoA synthetase (AMP-forming)/AMP-acid ligase II [Acidovorax sp. 100]|uniref:class I adenylate-forming enzyme family protein n=1 Tax=Acidovorax sp. 100 TaxID=2135635 RepID=UPI000EF9929D|nr:AMP-binding protein [Acidovorax sp. 100]RMA59933.1 acyl-CoA synthetase (AMP-forming)/AMP-acid ligase II [Acidovorax sp. 100]